MSMVRAPDSTDTPSNENSVGVITHSLWQRLFASDPGVLGRVIRLDDAPVTIVGVTAPDFSGLELGRTDVFTPIVPRAPGSDQRDVQVQVVARLIPGTERALTESATATARRLGDPLHSADDSSVVVLAGSVVAARGPASPDASRQITTRLAGVAGFVLLIALANVSGLMLVRGMRRRREIAMQLAIGASRRRLLRQLLIESATLAALASAAAVVLAFVGGSALRNLLLPTVQWARPPVDERTLLFTAVVSAVAALAVGLAPGMQLGDVDLKGDLGVAAREGRQRRPVLRSGLLAAQAAFSVVLLAGAALFLRSLATVAGLPVGYDKHDVAWIYFPEGASDPERASLVMDGMRAVPGVQHVATASAPPMIGWGGIRIYLPGRDSLPRLRPNDPGPQYLDVSPDYFEASGLRLIAGRTFEPGESGAVIVTKNMAELYWPGQDPLGQCIAVGIASSPCQAVIGVVEDARLTQILEEPRTIFFRAIRRPQAIRAIVFQVDERSWPAAAARARELVQAHLDPATTRVQSMTEALEPQLRQWKLGTQLFTVFSVLALLVTAVGTYSVMAYSVRQRTHEFGVRIALGARVTQVLELVLRDGLGVMAFGAAAGVVITFAFGNLLDSLLYGVTHRDPLALGAAMAVLLVTGATATLIPAWRAARVDPVRALSAE